MKSSLEIAQSTPLQPIESILEQTGVPPKLFRSYGPYTGKISLEALDFMKDQPDGKLILVTAMTPTPHGEGKTLTSVGLGQALAKLGKRGITSLREPSMGPVFGIKGGAAGGGYSQILPMENINLHFNGDIHAVSTAHNLLAAMLDNHMLKGNAAGIDSTNVLWPRAMDMNDRALRDIIIGLGGKVNGVPRESGFVITAASEIMAILALASSRRDLKERLGRIAIAFDLDKQIVKAEDIQAHKAMAAILNDAIMPNLVQTSEGTPALIHAGPFANIAHGTSSVLAAKTSLKLADYVVTEAGFGADLGAEKFFNIVCRQSGMWPSAVVLVATVRALKHHGGVAPDKLTTSDPEAMKRGWPNLQTHIQNMRKFGVPVVVALNRFPHDTDEEIATARELCASADVEFAPHTAFVDGGAGATELAKIAVDLAEASTAEPRYLYELSDPVATKIEKVAAEIYRTNEVNIEKKARNQINRFTKLGYGDLPICIAKTQNSLSHNPKALGLPKDWRLTVTDVSLSAGAGFLVVVCGNMMLMPGLPQVPAAVNVDVDDNGVIQGLF